MLEMMDIGIEQAVAYRVGGKITEEEMKTALSSIKDKINIYGKVYIYQEIESIGGVELDAILEKLKFFSEVGLSNISRIAVISQKKWMNSLIDLEGKFFKNIDMKGFSIEDKDKAIKFLKKE